MSRSTARQTWMAILAKSSLVDLEQQVKTLGKIPKYTFLRNSEIGLAMVRGKAGGTGEAFNLGEMTVTRCVINMAITHGEETSPCLAIKMKDIKGFGYVGGRSKLHAELAAVCDGLLQQNKWRDRVQELVIQPLQTKLIEQQQKQQNQTEATKVEFFTMLRGE